MNFRGTCAGLLGAAWLDFRRNLSIHATASTYADASLRATIQTVVDSAGNRGCNPDLILVASSPLEALRALLAKI